MSYLIKFKSVKHFLTEEEETLKCCHAEKNVICNKPAKFVKDDKCFCLKHSKKQPYRIPTSELKPAYVNKQKLQKLHDIAVKYNITYETPIKKPDLVSLINQHIIQTCFKEVKNTNKGDKKNTKTLQEKIKLKNYKEFDS